MKKIYPPTYFIILLIIIIIFGIIINNLKIIFFPYNLIGILLIIFGIIINLWTDNLYTKEKTTVKPDKKPNKLITNGPFKISRHPMYLGMFSILLGTSLLFGDLLLIIFPLLFIIIMEVKYIPIEEKNLVLIFGKKYISYKRKVRKWI